MEYYNSMSIEKLWEFQQFTRDETERRRIANLTPEELVHEVAPMYYSLIQMYSRNGLTHLWYNSIYSVYEVFNKEGIIEPFVRQEAKDKICELMMEEFEGCRVYFEKFHDYDSILNEWSFHIDWSSSASK
jgi:hypothetical protein